jgi:hypothetical protein
MPILSNNNNYISLTEVKLLKTLKIFVCAYTKKYRLRYYTFKKYQNLLSIFFKFLNIKNDFYNFISYV